MLNMLDWNSGSFKATIVFLTNWSDLSSNCTTSVIPSIGPTTFKFLKFKIISNHPPKLWALLASPYSLIQQAIVICWKSSSYKATIPTRVIISPTITTKTTNNNSLAP
ncbi:hypothetical protein ACTFIU_001586 [Dictyostelium citrinum]